MSEEEKEAIEQLRSWRKYIIEHREIVNKANDIEFYLRTTLNLIENQQKELNTLKEIEQQHKTDNGLLRQELDMQIQHNKELETTLKQTQDSWFEDTQKLEQEKEKNKNTGKLVENKIDGTIGIVLREWKTGQIQVLEKIQPKVINTHDSWKTLEVIEDE